MARERRSLFPIDTPLLQRCDRWHISEISAPADSSLISIAVIRRDLVSPTDYFVMTGISNPVADESNSSGEEPLR